MRPKSNPVKNTISAATDITIANRILNVTGVDTTGDAFLPMNFNDITNANGGLLPALADTPTILSVAYTDADNTTYRFVLTQAVNGEQKTAIISYNATTGSGSSDATIAARLVAAVNSSGLAITATGSASPITLQADAGSPFFQLSPTDNIDSVATVTTAIVSSTDATPIVLTVGAVPSYIVKGSTVTVAGHLTNTNANGTWRVSAVTGTEITLEGTTATGGGAGGATGTVAPVAQASRGDGTTMLANGITGAVAGKQYSSVAFDFDSSMTPLLSASRKTPNSQTLWIDDTASNYAAFAARVEELLQAFIPAGSAADGANPEILAVADAN